jgi:DNA-binding NarL/FixJ family response regulator
LPKRRGQLDFAIAPDDTWRRDARNRLDLFSVIALVAWHSPRPVRVLVVDDHPLFAKTLVAVLAGDPELEVVGLAGEGREALALAELLDPDVIALDLQMPVMSGFEVLEQLRGRRARAAVVVMTASDSPGDERRSYELGADGFLTKDRVATDLRDELLLAAGYDSSMAPSSRSSASLRSRPPP